MGQAFFVEHGNACDPPACNDQVGRESERSQRNVLQRLRLLVEQAQDFFARRCPMRVQNSTAGVGVFQPEYQLCSVVLSPADQFVNALRRFFQQELYRGQIANPIARLERILQVQTDFILIAQPRRIAFRIVRLEVGEFFLGKHKHTPGLGQFDGRAQAGDARADHHEISLGWKDLHKPGK